MMENLLTPSVKIIGDLLNLYILSYILLLLLSLESSKFTHLVSSVFIVLTEHDLVCKVVKYFGFVI